MTKQNVLQQIYEKQYVEGYSNAHSAGANASDGSSLLFDTVVFEHELVESTRVLEVGCGDGALLLRFAQEFEGEFVGIDCSETAIKIAQQSAESCQLKGRLSFVRAFGFEYTDAARFDVIIMNGVLEHIPVPEDLLCRLTQDLLADDGIIVVAVPHFFNLRGVVWMTLSHLFDAPMSRTDLHYFTPKRMDDIASVSGLELSRGLAPTTDFDWGNGALMRSDFTDRLPKVFAQMKSNDSHINKRVSMLNEFLQEMWEAHGGSSTYLEGATAVYVLRKEQGAK